MESQEPLFVRCKKDGWVCVTTDDGSHCRVCGWTLPKPKKEQPSKTAPLPAAPAKPAPPPPAPPAPAPSRPVVLPRVAPVAAVSIGSPVVVSPPAEARRVFRVLPSLIILTIGVGIGVYLSQQRQTERTIVSDSVATQVAAKAPEPLATPAAVRANPPVHGLRGQTPPIAPPQPSTITLTISSRPTGASVEIDGQSDQVMVTPASTELPLDDRLHTIRTELEGFEPDVREVRLSSQPSQHVAIQLKQLAVEAEPPTSPPHPIPEPAPPPTPAPTATAPPSPATLVVRASYPVLLTLGARLLPASPVHTVEVVPGPQTIQVTAPQAYLRRTVQIEARGGQTYTEVMPELLSVRVAAAPANCKVSINGWYAGISPLTVSVPRGPASFEFTWPGSGRSRTVAVDVSANGQSVFGTLNP